MNLEQFGQPQQSYDQEQVEWLYNYGWNKNTSFLGKIKAVFRGEAQIVRKK